MAPEPITLELIPMEELQKLLYYNNLRKKRESRVNREIARAPGVYFLFDAQRLLYIGSAKNIHLRVGIHLTEHRVNFLFVSFVIIEDFFDRMAAELLYIGRYKPILNYPAQRNYTEEELGIIDRATYGSLTRKREEDAMWVKEMQLMAHRKLGVALPPHLQDGDKEMRRLE